MFNAIFKIYMYLKFILLYILQVNVHSYIQNDFVIDYFKYKNAPTIAVFSCNSVQESFALLKDFSKLGVTAVFHELNNQSQIHLVVKTSYWKSGVLLDLQCYNYNDIIPIFHDVSNNEIFSELRYWLVLGSDADKILKIIDNRVLNPSIDFVIAIFLEDRSQYDLYDVYKSKVLNVTFFGIWSRENRLKVMVRQSRFNKQLNLNGIRLKAMFFKSEYKKEYVTMNEYLSDPTNPTLEGNSKFGFQTLKLLSELYNFTLEILESPTWMPGDKRGPVVTALVNNSIDMTGTPLTITPERVALIKFVHQDWPFRSCFIFRNPQKRSIKVQELLKPFQNDIWYLIALFFVIFVFTLIMALRFEIFNDGIMKFSNSFLIIVGALCQQGINIKMHQISTRMIFLFSLMFGLLIYNYYSASIVSTRLGEPIFKINDSLSELGQLHLKMSTEPMSYLEFLFQQNLDTQNFFQKYWSKIPENSRYMSTDIAIKLIKKGGFAFHTHPYFIYPLIEKTFDNQEICELMEVHLGKLRYTAFAVSMNSNYVEMARVGLIKISEVGLRRRLVSRCTARRPLCRTDIRSVSSITIQEFAPYFFLLIIGILLSISVYIIEIIIWYEN